MLDNIKRKVGREDASPFREHHIVRRPGGGADIYSQPVEPSKFWKDLEDSITDEEDDGDDGGYPFKILR